MNNPKSAFYFLLVVFSIFFFAVSHNLFSHGMFMDGVYYSTISRNMAVGLGSFWSPHFTDTIRQQFFDHPPLAFYLQSLFFRLFGDYHWVERLYSLTTYFIAGGLIIILWRKISPISQRNLYWIPLLLWVTIPKIIWSVSNNLLENTMMLFILSSIIVLFSAMSKKKIALFFLAGFILFLGVLTKGFTALFPLSFPFFYWLFKKPFSFLYLIKSYLHILLGLILPFILLLLLVPETWEYFKTYLNIQIFSGMDIGHSGRSRLYILKRVPQELLTMSILTVLIFLTNKFFLKSKFLLTENKKWVFVLFATALSGVLPIVFSLKQSTFYVLPTFSLFSIAFALIIAPFFEKILLHAPNKKQLKLLAISATSIFLLSVIVLIMPINQVNRDKEKLTDIRKIISFSEKNVTIGLDRSLGREWSYFAYFYRYGYVSLNVSDAYEQEIIILPKGNVIEQSVFKKIDLDLITLDLYKKNNCIAIEPNSYDQ